MLTIRTNNGILSFFESKVVCPYCQTKIPLEHFEKTFNKQKKHFIKHKCKCKHYFGITQDIKGDFVGFKLENKHHKEIL